MIDYLLGKKEKRIQIITNQLFELQGDEISFNQLSQKVKLNSRVVKETIYEYKSLGLEECGITILEIGQSKIKYAIQDFSSNRLQQLLVQKSYLFLLCKQLFTGEFVNLTEFSAETFTSLATMYRRLPSLKKMLEFYEIELDLINKPFFRSRERKIRNFLFELYYQAYGLTEEGYQGCEIGNEGNLKNLAYPTIKKINLLTYITKIRISQGYTLKNKIPDFLPYDSKLESEKLTNHFKQNVLEDSCKNYQQNELNFFISYILTLEIISIEEFENIDLNKIDLESKTIKLARKWISSFVEHFKLELSAQAYFFLEINLYYHFTRNELVLLKTKGKVKKFNNNGIFFKANNILWEEVNQFLAIVIKEFPDSLDYCEFYYILIRSVILSSHKKINICVFSGVAQAQKKYIEQEIERYSLVPVKFFNQPSEEINLIVSDYFFRQDSLKVKTTVNVETLFVKSEPTFVEYQIISKKILSIYNYIQGGK